VCLSERCVAPMLADRVGIAAAVGVIVRRLVPADNAAYEGFLSTDPDNLIYASAPFLSFLAEATKARITVLIAENAGRIVGALPYAVLDAPGFGRVVNSLPWWGSHGSVVLDRNAPDAEAIRRALLAQFVAELELLAPLSATVILLPAEEPFRATYEKILCPTISDGRTGQITNLVLDGPNLESRLLSSFRQKTRNLVRKGERQGFIEKVTDENWAWEFLWRTHTTNVTALGGQSKPKDHFAALRTNVPARNRRLSLAMNGVIPVAAMLTFGFNQTVEYITPVVEAEHRSRQPLSFLIFQGMLAAIRQGYTR